MIVKKGLLPILMAILMVFAIIPMTAGTVLAEEAAEPIEVVNRCGDEAGVLLQDPDTGAAVTQGAAGSEILITFSGGTQLDPSDPNYNEQNGGGETERSAYLIIIEKATGEILFNEQIGHNEQHILVIPPGGLKIIITYEELSDTTIDLTTEGYSMIFDGAGATAAFGGNYYIDTADDTVTPDVKVRFEAGGGNWPILDPSNYTLKYEKKTGVDIWEDYTADTFGVDEDGTATYRVSAIGKESLHCTGTLGPVEFNVIKKCKVTFDTHGGSTIDPQYIIPGEKAVEPAAPTREGWYFNEWFTDEGLTEEYWFNRTVNEDITLHAGWYTTMAIGVYNKSNPDTWPYMYQCGTVDIVADTSAEWSHEDAGTMNFSAPEGNITFTAKPAEGYVFKGWYGGVIGSSCFVEEPSDELLSAEAEYTCASGEIAICAVFECAGHQWEQKVQKATPDSEGRVYQVCSICGTENTEEGSIPLPKVSNIKLAKTSYVYTGKAIKPKVTVANAGEELSTDCYDVTYSNNTNVGTATVKVTLKGAYHEGTKTLTFKITPKKITPTVTLSASSYTYDGKVKKPTVTVKDGSTKLAASQYTVTYASGRKNVGKYNVKVTLKGNYSGTKTVSFKINPKGTTLKTPAAASKAATVKWTKQSAKMSSSRITGYQIQLATDSKFTKNKKTVTVKGYSKTAKKVTKLKGGKKYYVRIRTYKTVGGVNYCSPWSKVKTVTTKK